MSVVVHHVPQYQLTVPPVVIIFGLRRNLSTDDFINLIGGKSLRLHSVGKVSMRQAPLLKLHDVK